MKAGTRHLAIFVIRGVLAATLGALAFFAAFVFYHTALSREYTFDGFRDYWSVVFAILTTWELIFVVLLTALSVCTCITEERAKQTLPLLLMTRLTRFELIATKLLGRLVAPLALLAVGFPFILLAARFAGVPVLLLCEIAAVLVSSIVVAASLAILASAMREQTSSAQGEAIAWTMLWFVGFPMLSRLPPPAGLPGASLLAEIRQFAAWIAPASPISLFTDPAWSFRPGGLSLSNRLYLMLFLQAVLIVVSICGAVASLRLLEPHPTSWDPHKGYRPPVTDNPIYWREYLLPWRGSRLPAIVIQMRHMWIVVRAMLRLGLQLIVLMIAVAVPLVMIACVLWLGVRAFAEHWGILVYQSDSYRARDEFNMCVRAVSALFGVIPVGVISTMMIDRLTRERDRNTWESFLMTPLSGPEILRSKWRVSLQGMRPVLCALVAVWILGVACGSIHPLGPFLAAAAIVAMLWAGLAVGTWFGLRPGWSTRAANSVCAFCSVATMAVAAFAIVVPLATGRKDDAVLRGWEAVSWLPIIAILIAAVVLVGLFAWWLTRVCFRNFDAWVGRPHRPDHHPVDLA